jgi:hypothetical protein
MIYLELLLGYLAQLVEHMTLNHQVLGSNPRIPTTQIHSDLYS